MSSRSSRSWRRIDGVLLLDKSSGMTSNSALQSARRIYSAAKAGHTGTLDPLASGLLPLCFGEATKFSADLLEAEKTYEAEILFGVTTDTGDAEGAVLQRHLPDFGQADLEAALQRFRGRIHQIPPMYSALKRNGKPLYQLARQGLSVEREAREVTISELRLIDFSGHACRLHVSCSKGTYIRTLAEDIGNVLLCGAHLTALRRTAVGSLTVSEAITLDRLITLSGEDRAQYLREPDTLLQSLPAVHLDDQTTLRFMHGHPVSLTNGTAGLQGKCRVYGDSKLLGLGMADGSGEVKPRRLVCV
ncbi:MAG: tRNA pseudouridine(55) synthase TruB [Propionivibrio sp.]|uniref:tRNA pseudouridine(55) synthase TruB n=1 Tax=Propionivibrio sp. TaxID=2212460 RepID=UPI0025CCD166|nr:tRNA pseudouridine(55) synthase TruB [Propionivibrio sp.]MBK7356678.1 tRNA pseudouridine(55) synthase TruB [Propionivibrio sp.]MBK8894865.1 tRNA pseudouridine(55) synthase TruB [Propionivibrio sp.]